MTRGKTKRRRIAKAWRRAHQKWQAVGWDQDGIQLVDRGFAWFPKSKLSRYIDVTGTPIPKEVLEAFVDDMTKANAGLPRHVIYGDQFADAHGLTRPSDLTLGDPILEVPYPEGVEPGHYRITGISDESSIEVRP